MQNASFPILMYHSINSVPKATVMRSLHIPRKRFLLQMMLLKLFGYRGVSLSELHLQMLRGENRKLVGLTFDDGYKNNTTNALPILIKLGFTATIYIVSNNVGKSNTWDIEKGMSEYPMMNEDEIKHWIDSGMEIGSHTQNHKDLVKCNNKDLIKEIKQSKIDLEKKFNTSINHFCYPYGRFNDEIIKITKNSGYITGTSTQRGRSSLKDNLYTLPRVQITHHTLPHLFLLKVLSNYEDKRKDK